MKRLGSALARHTGQEESEAIRHVGQRMAVLLAKGNASLLLNRIPAFPSTEIDGQYFAILIFLVSFPSKILEKRRMIPWLDLI